MKFSVPIVCLVILGTFSFVMNVFLYAYLQESYSREEEWQQIAADRQQVAIDWQQVAIDWKRVYNDALIIQKKWKDASTEWEQNYYKLKALLEQR